MRATEVEVVRPHHLALLAEAYGNAGQTEEGLTLLDEALAAAHKNVGRFYEAELYRLKGQLTLQKFQVSGSTFQVETRRAGNAHQNVRIGEAGTVGGAHPTLVKDSEPYAEAEACFHKTIEIARKQQAKSLELRAVVSLSRLWQQQGRKEEARQMLADIYGWFTEGFDTKDLQEAKALLQESA
jgi:predicted ATPase